MNPAISHVTRGKTFYGPTATVPSTYKSDSIVLEGAERAFSHTLYTAKGILVSNRVCYARLMRNVSGSTMHRGRMVKSSSGYEKRRFDTYCDGVADRIAGVIDSHLNSSSGVRNGDMCWVFYQGPEYCVFAGGVAVAVNDWVYSNASGKFLPWTGLTSSTAELTGGTTAKKILHSFGVAEETAVSGDADALKLVDLCVR
jgi:hypothetical protein